GKCAGNFFQVLFAPPCDILKNAVEKLGVVRGNMRAYRKNVDDLQELHGQLQPTGKKAGIGKNLFSGLGSVQRYQQSSIHGFLLATCSAISMPTGIAFLGRFQGGSIWANTA